LPKVHEQVGITENPRIFLVDDERTGEFILVKNTKFLTQIPLFLRKKSNNKRRRRRRDLVCLSSIKVIKEDKRDSS